MIRPNQPKAPAGLPVENVTNLPAKLLKGGIKTGKDILDMAMGMFGEGATNKEIFDKTGQYVNKDVETGIRFNAAKQPVFDITDKDMKLTPYAHGEMSKPGGFLPFVDLSTAMKHDRLFEYDPDLKKVPTILEQTTPGSGDVVSGSYTPPGSKAAMDSPLGIIQTFGRGEPNDPTDMFSQRSILAHEINHLAANKYGLPAGANPGREGVPGSPGMRENTINNMVPQANKVRDMILKQREKWIKQQKGNPEADALWARLHPNEMDALEQAIFMGGGKMPMQSMKHPTYDKQVEYEGTSGEQTARTSQDMSTWTAEQMREESPYFAKAPWTPNIEGRPTRPTFFTPALQSLNFPATPNPKKPDKTLDWSAPDLKWWMQNLDTTR